MAGHYCLHLPNGGAENFRRHGHPSLPPSPFPCQGHHDHSLCRNGTATRACMTVRDLWASRPLADIMPPSGPPAFRAWAAARLFPSPSLPHSPACVADGASSVNDPRSAPLLQCSELLLPPRSGMESCDVRGRVRAGRSGGSLRQVPPLSALPFPPSVFWLDLASSVKKGRGALRQGGRRGVPAP
jgi:hypothetical protein